MEMVGLRIWIWIILVLFIYIHFFLLLYFFPHFLNKCVLENLFINTDIIFASFFLIYLCF